MQTRGRNDRGVGDCSIEVHELIQVEQRPAQLVQRRLFQKGAGEFQLARRRHAAQRQAIAADNALIRAVRLAFETHGDTLVAKPRVRSHGTLSSIDIEVHGYNSPVYILQDFNCFSRKIITLTLPSECDTFNESIIAVERSQGVHTKKQDVAPGIVARGRC